MTPPRKPLLARVWRKFFPAKTERVTLSAKPAPRPRPRPVGIEPLEGRIAPAALLNAATVVFTDLDGDTVTVTFSKPLFAFNSTALPGVLESVFEFGDSTGAHSDFGTTTAGQQLQQIDLTKVPLAGVVNPAAGVSIKITASGGNDAANVGAIKADGLALGTVAVSGDLGQIDCGSSGVAVGLKRLDVFSLGKTTATQTGTPDFESRIVGTLGTLAVDGDVHGYVHVLNGTGNAAKAVGKIGSVAIGGVLGSGGAARDSAGLIQTASDLGAVKISGDVGGGAGKNSGAILSGGKIASVTLGASLLGSGGEGSGAISATASIGAVKVTGDVAGGDGVGSGVIKAGGNMGAVSLGDDLVAGKGAGSAVISSSAAMGAVKISGDIDGRATGVGARAGGILAGGKLGAVTIEGSVFGGGAGLSGFVQSGEGMGAVKVVGSVVGGAGQDSGTISSGGAMPSVVIAGELTGGDGLNSGSVFSGFSGAGGIGSLRIALGAQGGAGDNSGAVVSGGRLGSVTIGSTSALDLGVVGGAGDFSGAIYARGTVGSVKLFHDLEGGAGANSGTITAHGRLASVTIDGAISGGQGAGSGGVFALDDFSPTHAIAGEIGRLSASGLQGGDGAGSGAVSSAGRIGAVKLGGFYAGAADGSGRIVSGTGLVNDGQVGEIRIADFGRSDPAGVTAGGTLEVHGSLLRLAVAGDLVGGKVLVAGNLGPVQISGGLIDSTISAEGRGRGPTIAQLRVGGDVAGSQILAGYSVAGLPVNADASIGALAVIGDWAASSLVAGVQDDGVNGFGDAGDRAIFGGTDDPAISSRIGSVVIGGVITGSLADGDRFGFVAQAFGSFRHAGVKLSLDSQVGGQFFELTSDVTVREVVPRVPIA